MIRRLLPLAFLPGLCLLSGCGVSDSRLARRAETNMLGMSGEQLESCVGVPDEHAARNGLEFLTYYANNSGSGGLDLTLPIVGGINFNGGGYCHATFTLVNDRVAELHYTGQNGEMLGPHGICALIVRSCVPSPDKTLRPPAPGGDAAAREAVSSDH